MSIFSFFQSKSNIAVSNQATATLLASLKSSQKFDEVCVGEATSQIISDIAAALKKCNWQSAASKFDSLDFFVRNFSSPSKVSLTKDYKALLAKQLNSYSDVNGHKLLVLAVLNGAPVALVQKILFLGADPYIRFSGKVLGQKDTDLTLLHGALANGHLGVARVLIESGVNPAAKSRLGYVALPLFFQTHHNLDKYAKELPSIIKAHASVGFSFGVRDQQGKTVVNYLASNKLLASFAVAVEAHAKELSADGKTELSQQEVKSFALAFSNQLLIKKNPYSKALDALNLILEKVASVSSPVAVANIDQAQVAKEFNKFLFSLFAVDPTFPFSMRYKDLQQAIEHLHKNRELFDAGLIAQVLNTPYSQGGFTLTFLHKLIELDRDTSSYIHVDDLLLDTIRKVLELGADPNQVSKAGIRYIDEPVVRAPVMEALKNFSWPLIEILVDHGALIGKGLTNGQFADYVNKHLKGGIKSLNILLQSSKILKIGLGEEKYQKLLADNFEPLRAGIKALYRINYPDVELFKAIIPDSIAPSTLAREEIITQTALAFNNDLVLQDKNLSDSELLMHCIKQGYLAPVILLLKAQCPLPKIYTSRLVGQLDPVQAEQDLRTTLLADAEYIMGFVFAESQTLLNRKHIQYLSKSEIDLDLLFSEVPNPADFVLPNEGVKIKEYVLKGSKISNFYRSRAAIYASEILKQDGNLRDARLMVQTIEAIGLPDIDQHGRAFAELLPNLLYRYPIGISSNLIRDFEFSHVIDRQNVHPIVAELFALLLHEEINRQVAKNETSLQLEMFTSGISWITDFIGGRKVVTGTAVNVWRSIGNITYGARRFRFEAQRVYDVDDNGVKQVVQQSFLEAFGAERLQNIGQAHPFQVGYAFYGKNYGDNETPASMAIGADDIIVMYRGGTAIYSPDIGYLFIRNSSNVFGRDLLKYPAYFSSANNNGSGNQIVDVDVKKVSASTSLLPYEVLSLTPEILEKTTNHILDPVLYPRSQDMRINTQMNPEIGINKIQKLIDIYDNFMVHFRRFGFDTDINTAWQKNQKGEQQLVGAYKSAGFAERLKFWRRHVDDAKMQAIIDGSEFVPPLALELHNRDLPPFSPYARLVLDDDVLTELERIVAEGWDNDDSNEEQELEVDEVEIDELSTLEELGLYKFMSLALQNQAELIVVPNKQ